MWHHILIFTHQLSIGKWANDRRQKLGEQRKAEAAEPKKRRLFGDESSDSSEPDGQSLKQMLESSEEEEVEAEERVGRADEVESEGDPAVSTQLEGHEEYHPDFDMSPL